MTKAELKAQLQASQAICVGLQREIATLQTELRNIAEAKPHKWDDPSDFRAWAQNRARHALTPNA